MNTHTYNEAYEASLKYFNGDELAASVFVTKYALRDAEGNLLEKTPTDMHLRLAREFARIEAKYPNPLTEKEIFCLLADVDHIDISERAAMTLDQLAQESRGFGAVVPQGSPMSAPLSKCILSPDNILTLPPALMLMSLSAVIFRSFLVWMLTLSAA